MVLLIYGGGSSGRNTYDLVKRNYPNRWSELIFINDFAKNHESELPGVETITFAEIFDRFKNNFSDLEAIVAVGEPSDREFLYNKLKNAGIKITTLIDETAIISPTVSISEGTIISEMTAIHSKAIIGNNVFINSLCTIGHDVEIGSHSVITANCAFGGRIKLGNRVFVGMSSALRENISVGNDAIVGMGSVVVKNVEDKATVFGNPARVIKIGGNHKIFKHN